LNKAGFIFTTEYFVALLKKLAAFIVAVLPPDAIVCVDILPLSVGPPVQEGVEPEVTLAICVAVAVQVNVPSELFEYPVGIPITTDIVLDVSVLTVANLPFAKSPAELVKLLKVPLSIFGVVTTPSWSTEKPVRFATVQS
jgi:hypothetical protein